jgi:hypothetical protein
VAVLVVAFPTLDIFTVDVDLLVGAVRTAFLEMFPGPTTVTVQTDLLPGQTLVNVKLSDMVTAAAEGSARVIIDTVDADALVAAALKFYVDDAAEEERAAGSTDNEGDDDYWSTVVDAASSGADASKTGASNSTTVVIVVVLAVFIIIGIAAFVYVRTNNDGGDGEIGHASFENPMYGEVDQQQNAVVGSSGNGNYADAPTGGGGESNSNSGYMDVAATSVAVGYASEEEEDV